MGTRMNSQIGPSLFESKDGASSARRQLRVYRPDGALSVIYVTAFESDAKAISEAERIARYGYQVDVLRDGTRIDRISELGLLDLGEHQ
jgi:hypothetical protein